jgi:hypothetical protein
MRYPHIFIPESEVPQAAVATFDHVVETYVSETNKVASIWSAVPDDRLDFRAHPKSSAIRQIMAHQILSERRFFAEFLGFREPQPDCLLPDTDAPIVNEYVKRYVTLARQRLPKLAAADEEFWLAAVPFFDVLRQRIWVFWRRVLHTAHHRTQVADCLRLLDIPVPAVYGPTADVSWDGADPTNTVDAAGRP